MPVSGSGQLVARRDSRRPTGKLIFENSLVKKKHTHKKKNNLNVRALQEETGETEQRRIPHFALSHASHSNIPQAFDTTNVMELY